MTVEQLLKLRSHYRTLYRNELAAENVGNGKKSGNRILTRFS
jgi:hypothetical protein